MRVYNLKVNDKNYEVAIKSMDLTQVKVEVNGVERSIQIGSITNVRSDGAAMVDVQKPKAVKPQRVSTPVASSPAPSSAPAGAGALKAPIPGQVKTIYKNVGDTVSATDKVLMLEAMKMENEIEAGVAGTIKEIRINPGDNVAQDQVLVVIG